MSITFQRVIGVPALKLLTIEEVMTMRARTGDVYTYVSLHLRASACSISGKNTRSMIPFMRVAFFKEMSDAKEYHII